MNAYLKPGDLTEAAQMRAEHPDYMVLAGGTDLLVLEHNRGPQAGVLDLFGLPELVGLDVSDDAIVIGAATTYAEILGSVAIKNNLPALWQCVREIGATQIQARGTIGGNIMTSSPVGDTLPVMLALDATLELTSAGANRQIPYREFCTGYRKTAAKPDELLARVIIPKPASNAVQYWRKVGTRAAQAISKVMVSAYATRDEHGALRDCRLAFGAVADRPIRLADAEAVLEGQTPSIELADRVAKAVRNSIKPINDVRSTADYRLNVAGKLAARFIRSMA